MPQTDDISRRTKCGTCVDVQSVNSPVAGNGSASTARGSIAVGITRCWTSRRDTTTVARRRAAA